MKLTRTAAIAALVLVPAGAAAQNAPGKLLLSYNDPSQPFRDDSPSAHLVSPQGGVSWSAELSPAGGGSGYFDGTGSLHIGPSADFEYPGDFTIDSGSGAPGTSCRPRATRRACTR